MTTGQTYTLSIVVQGEDKATGPLKGAGNALGGIGTIAAGILASQLFTKIAEGIIKSGRAAIDATANYQMMQVGLESLLAREISRGVTTQALAAQSASLSNEEQVRIYELKRVYEELSGAVAETSRLYEETAAAQGAGSEQALRLKIELDGLNGNLATTKNQLAGLNDQADGTVLAMQAITTGTMSIKDAMPQAQEKARDLLKQIRLLAIQSPYELSTVQSTLKLGMAFGMTSNEAMKFTRGILTMAAGVGASNEQMGRMSYNFAQIRMQGKVTAMDVRQLAMAGFDLTGALQGIGKEFGLTIKTTDDFNKAISSGKLTWEQFATGFEQYADKQFGGASERLSRTWSGMMSNFNDVFALTMPEIMGPALEKVTGFLNGLMDKFIEFTNSGQLEIWGEKLGNMVQGVLDFAVKLQDAGKDISLFFELLGRDFKVSSALIAAFDIKLPPGLADFFNGAQTLINDARQEIDDMFGNPFKVDGLDGLVKQVVTFFELLQPGRNFSFQEALNAAFGVQLPPEIMAFLEPLWGYVEKIKGAFISAKPFIDGAFAKFGEFWAANGPGIVQFFTDITTKIREFQSNTFEKIVEVMGDLAARIIPWLAAEFEKVSAWFVENGPLIQSFLAVIKERFNDFMEVMKVVVAIVCQVLRVLWDVLQPILSGIFKIIGELVQFVMQLVTGDWAGAWNSIMTIVVTAAAAIWEAVVALLNGILGFFGTNLKEIGDFFVTKWEEMKTGVITIWENLKTGIVTKFTEIKASITTWLTETVTAIKDKVGAWRQAAMDLVAGLRAGLQEKIDGVKNWLNGVWEDIVATAKRILGIKSPSTVFAGIGENLMLGMARGIGDGVDVPVNAIAGAADDMNQMMPGLLGGGGSSNTSNTNHISISVSGSGDPLAVARELMGLLNAQGVTL